MRSKIVVLVVALLIGGAAAILAGQYLQGARTQIEAQSKPVEVLVAAQDIPRGMTAEDLITKKMLVKKDVPLQYVSAGSVSSLRAIEGKVLSSPLTKGEQVTEARFQYPSQAGLAYGIPENSVAIAIPTDAIRGVAGLVKPGDKVSVYATFGENEAGKKMDITKMLLPSAHVLAVGQSVGAEADATESGGKTTAGAFGSTSQQNDRPQTATLTLAIPPADAEKLIFAEEVGKIWLSLLPTENAEVPATTGRTMQTIFR